MCGRSWTIWGGVVSDRWDGRANGMRKPSVAGVAWNGPPLKKSPNRRAHDNLHRRKRNKPAAAPGAHLGETPVLQYNFNWDTLSAAAGITFHNFYFRLYKGTVKSAEVVDFLQALLRHIPGRLLIVWDRLSAHRSKLTRDFIAGQGGRLWVEYLPGYAP